MRCIHISPILFNERKIKGRKRTVIRYSLNVTLCLSSLSETEKHQLTRASAIAGDPEKILSCGAGALLKSSLPGK